MKNIFKIIAAASIGAVAGYIVGTKAHSSSKYEDDEFDDVEYINNEEDHINPDTDIDIKIDDEEPVDYTEAYNEIGDPYEDGFKD